MALYPLSYRTKGKDIGVFSNPPGVRGRVRYATGPDGRPNTATQFFGKPNSYIQFPNKGKLDTKRSITLLAWIYNEGSAGPIFNYMPNGWGVHLWMTSPVTLFARFTRRQRRRFTPHIQYRGVAHRRWQYIGATYSGRTGVAKLYLNSRLVARKRIGKIRLATNYPVRMGARVGDSRFFKGRISCMQVYGVALNTRQIAARSRRCFLKSKYRNYLCFVSISLQCTYLLGCLSFCLFVCQCVCVCLYICLFSYILVSSFLTKYIF